MPISDPTDIADCAFWFDAESGRYDATSGGNIVTATDGAIARWENQAGSGLPHLTQASSGNRPTYDPTGVNGLPALKFVDGSRFLTTGVLGSPLSQPNTTFVVFRNTNKDTLQFIYDGAATGGRNLLWIFGAGLQVGAYAGGAHYDYASAEPGVYIYCIQYNGASTLIRRNGVPVADGDVGSQAMGGLTIGTDNAGGGLGLTGWVREFVSYNAALSLSDIQDVEAYLAANSDQTLYTQAVAGTIGGDNWVLLVPPLYAGGTKRLVMYHHGRLELAGVANALISEAEMVPMLQALLAAGYFVAASDAGGPVHWGNQAAQDAYAAFWALLDGRETWDRLGFWGRSMGGLTAQSGMADSRFGRVAGVYGTYPVCDLDSMYDDGNGQFAGEILTAYDANSGTYVANTLGYNPIAASSAIWSNRRWRAIASYGDTVVGRTDNADAMSTHVADFATESDVMTHTGDHGDPTAFDTADITGFFGRAFADSPTDTTPPTLSDFATDTAGSTITATLSESDCGPATGTGTVGFTLHGTYVQVTSWSISGTTLTLNLRGTVYAEHTTPTIDYSATNVESPIHDGAGNLLASISGASVTNNSTVNLPTYALTAAQRRRKSRPLQRFAWRKLLRKR